MQDEMLAVMLSTHNEAREEVGVPPLVLDDDLSAQALEYAQELADTGRFEHSAQGDRPGQGENLWAGTASAFPYEEMSGVWIDEKEFYVHMRFPYVSSTGNWQDVGHYTQIIWRDTTQLGCGLATGNDRDYLVCRYAPPGNFVGEYAY
ncbi:MAG: CAP domain-containing protein [Pseudomonadota bacterium]